MTDKYENANRLLKQCLQLSDQAIKNQAQQKNSDQTLSELETLTKSIPADASDSHAQLFEHFSQSRFSLASRSEDVLALNPQQSVADHWDSTHNVRELCNGMIHGGVLTLGQAATHPKVLLFGGCFNVNYGIYKRKGKLLDRCSGIGMTAIPLDCASKPITQTVHDIGYLNKYAFGEKGVTGLIKTIRESKRHPFSGQISARQGKGYFMFRHLQRTSSVDRQYAFIRGSARHKIPPFNLEGTHSIFGDFKPSYPMIRRANNPRDQFSDMFEHPNNDPFSPWFKPTVQDNELLHQSAYIRVIHPEPKNNPAIVTYIVGERLIRHQARRNDGNRWKLVKNKPIWSTRMAIIG